MLSTSVAPLHLLNEGQNALQAIPQVFTAVDEMPPSVSIPVVESIVSEELGEAFVPGEDGSSDHYAETSTDVVEASEAVSEAEQPPQPSAELVSELPDLQEASPQPAADLPDLHTSPQPAAGLPDLHEKEVSHLQGKETSPQPAELVSKLGLQGSEEVSPEPELEQLGAHGLNSEIPPGPTKEVSPDPSKAPELESHESLPGLEEETFELSPESLSGAEKEPVVGEKEVSPDPAEAESQLETCKLSPESLPEKEPVGEKEVSPDPAAAESQLETCELPPKSLSGAEKEPLVGGEELSPQPLSDDPELTDKETSLRPVPRISPQPPGKEESPQPAPVSSLEPEEAGKEESPQPAPVSSPEPEEAGKEEYPQPAPVSSPEPEEAGKEEYPQPTPVSSLEPEEAGTKPKSEATERETSPHPAPEKVTPEQSQPEQDQPDPELSLETESDKEVSPQPVPEASPEPESQREASPQPVPEASPEPESQREASPQPVPEASPEPESQPVEREASPRLVPEASPKPESQPIEREASPHPVPDALPQHKPESQPVASPQPVLEASPEPESQPVASPQPVPEASPEPESQREASPQPVPEASPEPESQPVASPQPVPEASPEPESQREASPQPVPEASPEPESQREASPQPVPEASPEPESQREASPHPVRDALPQPEPESQPVEREVSPQPIPKVSLEPKSVLTEKESPPEPVPELELEPGSVPESVLPEAREVLPEAREARPEAVQERMSTNLPSEEPQEAVQLTGSDEHKQNPGLVYSTGNCTNQDQTAEASEVVSRKGNEYSDTDKHADATLQQSVATNESNVQSLSANGELSVTGGEDMPEASASPAMAAQSSSLGESKLVSPPEEGEVISPDTQPPLDEENRAVSPVSQHSSLAESEAISPAVPPSHEESERASPATQPSSREGSLFSPMRQPSSHGGSSVVSPAHSDRVLESSTNTTTSSSSAMGNDELSPEPSGAGSASDSPATQRMGQSMMVQGSEGHGEENEGEGPDTLHMSLMPSGGGSEKKHKKKEKKRMQSFLANSRKSFKGFGREVKRAASVRTKVKQEDSSPSLLSPVMTQDWDPTCLLEDLYSDFRPSSKRANVTGEMARYYGYLEKLPKNTTKSSVMKGWKRRYFRVMDDKIFYYEDRTTPKALGFVRLSISRINLIPEKNQIQIIEKGGQSIMLRARDKDDVTSWHRSLLLEAAHPTLSVPSSPTANQDQSSVLIIDIGAASVRAGFARSNAYPEAFFPAVASIESTSYEPIASGNEALIPDNRYGAYQVYPRKHSLRMDKHDSNLGLRAMECIITTIISDLDVEPESTDVIVTVPPSVPTEERNELAEILFDVFLFAAICFHDQCILSLYSYNATSGVVVNIGDHIDVVPIIDGYTIEAGASHLPHGGNAVTESLSKLVTSKGLRYFSETEMYIIRLIKERLCYVSEDYARDLENCESNPATYTCATDLDPFQLPDHRKVVALDAECFKASEGLFDPNKWGKDVPGIHELVWKAVQASPIDQRREMAKKIYLSGSTTLLPGLKERLQKEVSQLGTTGLAVEVHVSESQQHAAFVGASVLAMLGSFQSYLITRDEFSSIGFEALRK